jgi:hypothetical protein
MYIQTITDTQQYDDTIQNMEHGTGTESYSMQPTCEQISSEKFVTNICLYYTIHHKLQISGKQRSIINKHINKQTNKQTWFSFIITITSSLTVLSHSSIQCLRDTFHRDSFYC